MAVMEKLRGYTLIELLTVMVIVVILAGIAVPSYNLIQNRSRVNADWNTLHTALNYARNAAISRGSVVALCPSENGSSCGGEWSDGWLLFVDGNGNGSFDAGEEILRVQAGSDANSLSLQRANGSALATLSFNNRGFASASSTFTLCDVSRESSRARAILILNSGRVIRSRPDDEKGLHRDISYEVLSCA